MTGASPAPPGAQRSAPEAVLTSALQVTPPPAPLAVPASTPEATAMSYARPLAPPATPFTVVPAPATTVAPVPEARIIPFPYVSADPDTTEVPLIGGDMTEGVVRVGRTVRRPVRPHTPAVHALLRHLEAVGFEGAPRALGSDARNREVLTYIPGIVARRPLPGFVTADSTLASLAELQLRYHHAVASFEPPDWARWDGEVTRFVDGPPEIICHCDVNLENVIFRAGPAGRGRTRSSTSIWPAPGRGWSTSSRRCVTGLPSPIPPTVIRRCGTPTPRAASRSSARRTAFPTPNVPAWFRLPAGGCAGRGPRSRSGPG